MSAPAGHLAAPRPVTPASILADRLARVLRELDELGTPESSWLSDLRSAAVLAAGLDPYLDACATAESPDLGRLAARTRARDWSQASGRPALGLEQEMLSGHVEGQTLKFLVHATRATRVLEIGLFTGYSALAMAEALAEGGRVVSCEIDPETARFAQEGLAESAAGHRVEVRVAPALETLAALASEGQRFDLVFIDADKAGYTGYLDAVLEHGLLAEHGVVCVDNTLMQGQPWGAGEATANGEAIAAFNVAVAADPRVEQVIVPLRDGLSLIRPVAPDPRPDTPDPRRDTPDLSPVTPDTRRETS